MKKSTRRKHMPGHPDILLNLDWFFQRGLLCRDPQRVETVFSRQALPEAPEQYKDFEGEELSDHDAVVVSCTVPAPSENTVLKEGELLS